MLHVPVAGKSLAEYSVVVLSFGVTELEGAGPAVVDVGLVGAALVANPESVGDGASVDEPRASDPHDASVATAINDAQRRRVI